jgi:hypothetical protein
VPEYSAREPRAASHEAIVSHDLPPLLACVTTHSGRQVKLFNGRTLARLDRRKSIEEASPQYYGYRGFCLIQINLFRGERRRHLKLVLSLRWGLP